MKISLGFSPCPNDTFIFDALVNNKIDTEGIEFNLFIEDVQTLNQWAIEGKLDITKISFGVLPLVVNYYSLLKSGSALGRGVGPLLIGKDPILLNDITKKLIAIPGKNTTAHFLFSLAYPNAKNKVFMRFNEIENFVQSGKGLGVIIHENRFTYLQKGLCKIADLGEYWEKHTGNPIPLGGIVGRKQACPIEKIDTLIRKSIEYAFAKYPEISVYVKQHAQEMSEEIMRQHIELYVNKFSINLGAEGEAAIKTLLEIMQNTN